MPDAHPSGFPPRSPTSAENTRNPETTDVCCHDRCMARDRPSHYGERGQFLIFSVARGPVPRDLSTSAKNARNPETTDVCCHDRCMARDRPSPYGKRAIKHGEGQALALREPPERIETRRALLPGRHQDREGSPTGVHRSMKHPPNNKL